MFTDHMFFSGTIEISWILILLTSIATSYRAQCLNKCLDIIMPTHSTRGIAAPSISVLLLASRKFGASCSSNFGSDARVARTVRDLFPSDPCVPVYGKEETSC
jgi:hypothetical protein